MKSSFFDSKYGWALAAFPNILLMYCLLRVRNHTMTSLPRAKTLWKICKKALNDKILGDLVECGVWKGGSAGIMAMAARGSHKKIHLYDSFEGLPEPSALDGEAARNYSGGVSKGRLQSVKKCVGLLPEVQDLLQRKLKIRADSIRYHVGWFQKTLKPWPPQSISVLRLDGDWYESTKICLDNLYPGLAKGGFVLLDDYFCWEGCRKATDEFRKKWDIKEEMHKIDSESVYWIKKN